MYERKVSPERSGWRDKELAEWHHKHGFAYSVADLNDLDLNLRHKEWGWNCPAVDIDKLFLEYDNCQPVTLMDYKFRERLNVPEPRRDAANNLALSRLCKDVPFYVTIYTKHPWSFRPIWINTPAKELASQKQFLTEVEFVQWLYQLRNRIATSSITSKLDNQITWQFPPPSNISNRHGTHKRRQNKTPVPTLFDQAPVQQQDLWKVLV